MVDGAWEYNADAGELRATLDTRVYSVAAIQKAGYRVADICTVRLGELQGDRITIALMLPPAARDTPALTDRIGRRFFQELLDQNLRETIGAETKELRALILAHAFSRTQLIR